MLPPERLILPEQDNVGVTLKSLWKEGDKPIRVRQLSWLRGEYFYPGFVYDGWVYGLKFEFSTKKSDMFAYHGGGSLWEKNPEPKPCPDKLCGWRDRQTSELRLFPASMAVPLSRWQRIPSLDTDGAA